MFYSVISKSVFYRLSSTTGAIATFLVLFLSSCEKVVNVRLEPGEKRYVIEGVISNGPGVCRVLVSQTQALGESTGFTGVSGAHVTLTINNGVTLELREEGKGVYESIPLIGQVGATYRLVVNVDGRVFSASSTMPAFVRFDDATISERELGGGKAKYATVHYTDPAGKGNAYRFIQFVNGVKTKAIFVNDDALTDGRTVNADLLFFEQEEREADGLKPGDQVDILMQTIDTGIYKYWYSLGQSATGETQSANPSNPVSNIVGGALGYFSAHTVQARTLIVP